MPEKIRIELVSEADLQDFKRYQKYRSLLGSAFRLSMGIFSTGSGLTKDEVGFLIKYLQNRDRINEIFKVKGGSGTIHQDSQGNIMKVEIHTQIH